VIDVAVVGCGHMGARHAAVLSRDSRCRLVCSVDIVRERALDMVARFGGEALEGVPEGVDAVVVATPTSTHEEVAAPLLARGLWCLVEKPLVPTVQAAERLSSPRLVVGHIERFNPAVRAAGPMRPRYLEARREAPPTGRSADIDVVLDLMIHDLDLILHWSEPGATIEVVDAVGVGDPVDTASVRLRTSDGLTATLVASRVAVKRARWIHVFEVGRYTTLDLLMGRAHRLGRQLTLEDGRDALTAQWDAFRDAVIGNAPAKVTSAAGGRAVKLADQILSRIRDTSLP